MEGYKVDNVFEEESKDWKDKLNAEIDHMFLELTPRQEEMDYLNRAYTDFKLIVD
jgi:hypothetical protein